MRKGVGDYCNNVKRSGMKRSTFILGLFLVAGFICGCKGGGNSRIATSSEGGTGMVIALSENQEASTEPYTIDFGRVRSGEIVTKTFSIKNSGDKPVVIINFTTDCGCMTFTFSREPIQPGEEKQVEVNFNSGGYYGSVTKKAGLLISFSENQYNIILTANVE